MTDTERRQLADIERMLRTESPDLAKLLSGTSGPGSGTGRTCWWIGGPVAIVSLALLSLGAALGQAGLAIFAICPAATFSLLTLWERRRTRRVRTGAAGSGHSAA